MNNTGSNLYIKPDETKFLSMSVVSMIEQLEASAKDERLNWNVQSRKDLRDMIDAGKRLKIKMERIGIAMPPIPPYIDGEEKDYLTKES